LDFDRDSRHVYLRIPCGSATFGNARTEMELEDIHFEQLGHVAWIFNHVRACHIREIHQNLDETKNAKSAVMHR
jgi:hypothetical protein